MVETERLITNIIMTLDGGQGRDVVDAAISAGLSYRLYAFGEACESPIGSLGAGDDIVASEREAYFIASRLDDDVLGYREKKLSGTSLCHVVHRTAHVSTFATLGENVFVGAMAVINPQARIDDFVFINAGCVIDHDCSIGAGSTLGPGVKFPGVVSIGRQCAIGAGVVARPGVTVADGCTIGAGAVIAGDITEPGVYVGNPARRLVKK